jgi:DNA-binding beta-propeller fold protein YncE
VIHRFAAVFALLAAAAGSVAAAPTRSSPIAVQLGASVDQVFVVNPDSDSVARIDFDATRVGALVWEAKVGRYPRTVAGGGDGSAVFAVSQSADSISRIDAVSGAVTGTSNLGFGCSPYGVATTPDAGRVVVTCQGTSELLILDRTPGVIARVKLAWPNARAIAISADALTAYVTHFLTEEPGTAAHVSVVDLANGSVARVIEVPVDEKTCETQNSGQGVLNLISAIALVPDGAPADVAGQLWIGGTQQNNVNKGLFKRSEVLKSRTGAAMFPFTFRSFPDGGTIRNVYKASFHDITRFGIVKLNAATGAVVGKIDIDEANTASDIQFSPDGRVAYVVDQMFNSYHVFNTARGQGTNPTTLFASVSSNGPGGADASIPCAPNEGLQPVSAEAPFRLAPQAQISVIDGYDPVDATNTPVKTGADFDIVQYMTTGESRMLPGGVPDGIGTAPVGLVLSPGGGTMYVANYLARNVVPVATAIPLDGSGKPDNFRCVKDDINKRCATNADCSAAVGFCNHPGGAPCTQNADCGSNGPCVVGADCVPLILGQAVSSITGGIAADPLPAALLDGKNLFNTAARDSSNVNIPGLSAAAPRFNDPLVSARMPGSVTSTSHDASYVTCTSCHADYGGQDGRTWDFAQFGASLRNTMELRGRAGFAPGTCSNEPTKECFFDAACGDGNPASGNYCKANPAMVPFNITGADRDRYFNPMLTVHWNGDRDEVEDFEHTFRQLQGAGDCDSAEDAVDTCMGALIQRSTLTSTDPVDVSADLGPTNRNIRGIVDPSKIVGIRLTHMADFVYSLTEFVKNPNPPSASVERGRKIFNDPLTQCASCHNGGPGAGKQFFTDKKPNPGFDPAQPGRADRNNPFLRHDVGTANVFDQTDPFEIAGTSQYQNPRIPIPSTRGTLGDYITPVLNDLWNTAPYLHDGSAHTLLDVVRPCDTAREDCARPAKGRNLCPPQGCLHGVTSILTPRQLNDLVDFQNALTGATIVGTNERVLSAGALDLTRVVLKFGKKRGKGKDAFEVAGKLTAVPAGLDPESAGAVLSLAVPVDGRMVIVETPLAMRGSARRARGRAKVGKGSITVVLKRLRNGDWRLAGAGRRLDLSSLDVENRDLMVALELGETAFVKNRTLTGKKRVFKLPRRKKA